MLFFGAAGGQAPPQCLPPPIRCYPHLGGGYASSIIDYKNYFPIWLGSGFCGFGCLLWLFVLFEKNSEGVAYAFYTKQITPKNLLETAPTRLTHA